MAVLSDYSGSRVQHLLGVDRSGDEKTGAVLPVIEAERCIGERQLVVTIPL